MPIEELSVSVPILVNPISRILHSIYKNFGENCSGNNKFLQAQLKERIEAIMEAERVLGEIHEYEILCDDQNNPCSVLDTGKIDLQVMWKVSAEDSTYVRFREDPLNKG